MLSIERLERGAVTIMRLDGDIDEEGMNKLRLSLMHCIQERRCNVVLNMCDVRFVSYMGIGVMVERLRQLRACKGDLKLAGVNIQTDRLLRMAGVSKIFEVYETESPAVQAYQAAA